MKDQTKIRLDRMIASLGYASRTGVSAMLRAGRITADGTVPASAAAKVAPASVLIDGAPPDPMAPFTIMLNKPAGVTCSHEDPGRIIYDLLPDRFMARKPKLVTAGRLDRDTTGLLLMSDDGQLVHRLTSPKHHLAKRYLVTLERPLSGDEETAFKSGEMILRGEKTALAPALLEPVSETQARVSITEGRYHQVRRMFAACGNHVTALHREAIGGLELPDGLAPGAWRPVTDKEMEALLR